MSIYVVPRASATPARAPAATVLTFRPDQADGLETILGTLGLPEAAAEIVMDKLAAHAAVTLYGPRGNTVRLVAGGAR